MPQGFELDTEIVARILARAEAQDKVVMSRRDRDSCVQKMVASLLIRMKGLTAEQVSPMLSAMDAEQLQLLLYA
jgi:hypothetical protein